ncbi:tRNase Z TRZ1-like protein [Drosera capensis]
MSSQASLTDSIPNPNSTRKNKKSKDRGMEIEGQRIEGLSIGGQETCVIFPNLKIAFDIGRCPQRAVSMDFVLISHGHMDHIGGLPMYVATRGLFSMKPPTIVVPKAIKEHVEKLFEVHRAIDNSELKHNLIGLDVGEEFYLRKDLKVKAFRTYHVVPSQANSHCDRDVSQFFGREVQMLRLNCQVYDLLFLFVHQFADVLNCCISI